jgi:hypothetical protein
LAEANTLPIDRAVERASLLAAPDFWWATH